MPRLKKLILKTALLPCFAAIIILLNSSFSRTLNKQEWIAWSNKCLTECFDAKADPKLKKYEITLTDDLFFRLRKTYLHNKQEYYSFNLHKFSELDYREGSASVDTLQLKTQAEDIIVQTYDDPKGNIDSMTTILSLPIKKLSPQRLYSLRNAFAFLKT